MMPSQTLVPPRAMTSSSPQSGQWRGLGQEAAEVASPHFFLRRQHSLYKDDAHNHGGQHDPLTLVP